MNQRRMSNSPLLDPSVCALVIIAPDPRNPVLIDAGIRSSHQRNLVQVTKAAQIADVPAFTLSRLVQQQEPSPLAPLLSTSYSHQFAFGEDGSPWSHKGFVDALTAQDRSILVLAGSWLEHEILATALHALVDSYDVYVLLDATPPRSPSAYEPARDRLNQAGATPVITSQVIHEWSLEAAEASKRAALRSLLPALMDAE